jgi:hypothetical protein
MPLQVSFSNFHFGSDGIVRLPWISSSCPAVRYLHGNDLYLHGSILIYHTMPWKSPNKTSSATKYSSLNIGKHLDLRDHIMSSVSNWSASPIIMFITCIVSLFACVYDVSCEPVCLGISRSWHCVIRLHIRLGYSLSLERPRVLTIWVMSMNSYRHHNVYIRSANVAESIVSSH